MAPQLLHLPDKPAGVESFFAPFLADELAHLPGKPAGVDQTVDGSSICEEPY
jgi:hypothetical protein